MLVKEYIFKLGTYPKLEAYSKMGSLPFSPCFTLTMFTYSVRENLTPPHSEEKQMQTQAALRPSSGHFCSGLQVLNNVHST